MKKNNICVLMSTYNGEKYIEEQIESILNQKNVSIDIYVRDDCSRDNTLSILKQYQQKGLVKIIESSGNFGPAKSFMSMLYSVGTYDYYAFADQDDIWKLEKLCTAIEMISQASDSEPCLYCSNQLLYINGKEVKLRFDSPPNYTLTNCICGNQISGCTMVMNYALKLILSRENSRPSDEILKIRMHDTWVILVAELCGKVIYDSNSYINYRIHENNTVGISRDSFFGKIKKMVCKIFDKNKKNGRSRIAQELLEKIDINHSESKNIIITFAKCNDSLKNKLRLIKNKRIKRDSEEKRMLFLIKSLVGWI